MHSGGSLLIHSLLLFFIGHNRSEGVIYMQGASIKDQLKSVFGYISFRAGQEELINALLHGRDVLGIMPTGAGKSLCYQLPAIMSEGVSIVVSPLIALMNEQVISLCKKGVKAAYLNSSLTVHQQKLVINNIADGRYKIIYAAPERLQNEAFIRACTGLDISLIAVDEAHCVSQWGHDFRRSYLKISEFVRELPRRPVIGAFTATATKQVGADIIKYLELDDPMRVCTGYARPDLHLSVVHPKSMNAREKELIKILDTHKDECGIVYCSLRSTVDELYERLRGMGYPVARYHGGLCSAERAENQNLFLSDKTKIMLATNAFGMGIDKNNVRFVVHYNMPKDIESYYQEAGRAGRDGKGAECIMLYMPNDIGINEYLIKNGDTNDELTPNMKNQLRRAAKLRLNAITDFCNTRGCLANYILDYFGEAVDAPCGRCSSCEIGEKIRKKRRRLHKI